MINYIRLYSKLYTHVFVSHSTSKSNIAVQLFFQKNVHFLLCSGTPELQELCQKTDAANIVPEMLKLVDDATVARWLCGLTTATEIGQCHLVSKQVWIWGQIITQSASDIDLYTRYIYILPCRFFLLPAAFLIKTIKQPPLK